MIPRVGRLFLVSVVVVQVLASCVASQRVITGIVVDVESRGLMQVDGFTVKSGDELFEIRIDPDRDYSFPLDHLNAHRISGQPVRVGIEERDGNLVAVSIEDA